MLDIDSIASKDIVELVTYRQPNPHFKQEQVITIIRGETFYARLVNDRLHQWTIQDSTEDAKRRFTEAVQFEEELRSERL